MILLALAWCDLTCHGRRVLISSMDFFPLLVDDNHSNGCTRLFYPFLGGNGKTDRVIGSERYAKSALPNLTITSAISNTIQPATIILS